VRLLVKLLGDYLNEVAYPAELAGLSYSITNHLAGFQVRAWPGLLVLCSAPL
jgi:secreted Zn-dependent insulinase-like peptidase